jgi:hypothetical protein
MNIVQGSKESLPGTGGFTTATTATSDVYPLQPTLLQICHAEVKAACGSVLTLVPSLKSLVIDPGL